MGGKALFLPRTKSLEGIGRDGEEEKGEKKRYVFILLQQDRIMRGEGKEGRERRKGGGEGLENTKCIALFKVILREGYLDHFLVLNGYQ